MPIPFNEINTSFLNHPEKLYPCLCRWITLGLLAPGEKINDSEIAAAFKVSRTPVREALKRLEAQKLISTIPGKATMISGLETDDIEQWYAPMAVLQQLGTRICAGNITRENIDELREINSRFQRALKNDDVYKRFELDREFHDKIIEISGNEYIADFCDVLMMHIQRLECTHFKKSPYLNESVQAHENIINALENKDDYLAPMLMKDHWNATVLSINSILSKDRDNNPA